MAIGYLALCFAALFGIIALIGAAIPGTNCKPVKPAIDYKKIYADVLPHELKGGF